MAEPVDWSQIPRLALKHYGTLPALGRTSLAEMDMVQEQCSVYGGDRELATKHILDAAMTELNSVDHHAAWLLAERYVLKRSMRTISLAEDIPSSTLYEHHDHAVDRLAAILERLNVEAKTARVRRRSTLMAGLPAPTYFQLVGADRSLARTIELLERDKHTSPLFIVGLGGIGKTSLAREALFRLIHSGGHPLDQLIWVAVTQFDNTTTLTQHFDYSFERLLCELGEKLDIPINALPNNERRLQVLTRCLKDTHTLVVIDNVETQAEVRMVMALLEHMAPVAQVIITSRRRIDHQAGESIILSDLGSEDAITLLRIEAERLDLPITDEGTLLRIYDVVGGNPLALKLLFAQLRFLPIDTLVAGFGSGSITAQNLFSRIYDRAWSLLTEAAKQVMLAMWLLPPRGTDWNELVRMTGGDPATTNPDLVQTIEELTALNLIQVTPAISPNYSLHRLTNHYLEARLGLSPEGVGN